MQIRISCTRFCTYHSLVTKNGIIGLNIFNGWMDAIMQYKIHLISLYKVDVHMFTGIICTTTSWFTSNCTFASYFLIRRCFLHSMHTYPKVNGPGLLSLNKTQAGCLTAYRYVAMVTNPRCSRKGKHHKVLSIHNEGDPSSR